MAAKLATVQNSAPLAVTPLPETLFEEALSAATAKPGDESPWEKLEAAVVSDENQARQLLDFYRTRLTDQVPRPMLGVLSQRAVRFAADCFGENAPEAIEVLRAVIKASPDADWAFRPLVVALTMAERWPEVLDAYDTRLAVGGGSDRRADILEEATRIAKDFVGDHARAITYLDQLVRLRPADSQVAASLDRLLERHERWGELVAARRFRLELLAGAEAREQRLRIAATLHEKLGKPEAALAEVRALLPDLHDDAPLAGLLERLLADERAPADTRLEALDALRLRYEAIGAGARVPNLLRTAIGFATGDRLRELRRECGDRLQASGDVSAALDQYVALIALAPEDRSVEDGMRQLAEAARDPARLAAGLAAGAQACRVSARRAELLVRAARVEDRQLGHAERATTLLEGAIAEEEGPPHLRLESLRRLEELYDALGAKPKRVHALERLAAAEPKPGGQRFIWAVAAELALDLGDVDRALGAWHARLALDPGDVEALAAARALLVKSERWPAVIDLLRKRIESGPAAHQVRADLIEIATLARGGLADLGGAIDAWREIVTRFGDDDESVDALADLYTESGAFADLAALLSRNANVDRRRHADRLARLADAHRLKLGDAAAAVEWYGRALEIDAAHEGARAGLRALLADEAAAPNAARRLARAAEHTDDWQLLLELVPLRLAAEPDPAQKARLLEDAAACAEKRADDKPRALAWLCEALPLAGTSGRLEQELMRLAEATGDFAAAARALGAAIAAGGAAPLTLAHLHERRADLLETRLGDMAAASDSYAAALALTPERLEPRRRLLRALVQQGRFADAAGLMVDPDTAPAARDAVLLPLYESLAVERGEIRAGAGALAAAVDGATGLDPAIRRDLYGRAAGWFVDQAQDVDGGERAVDRALAADPRHVPTLVRRAELQRRRPASDRRLVDTLVQLAAEQLDNLDHLREAAEIAAGALADEALALDLLARLGDRAAHLLAHGARATGRFAAADVAAYAVDEAVRLHVSAGTPERTGRATAMLLDAARFRVSDERRHGWLRRAAELTETTLADRSGAIRIWRLLHEQAPEDAPAGEALARLYEAEGRFADAVSLRVAELAGSQEAERRLALRLEIVRLSGLVERQGDAPDVLRASLRERPGHGPTLRKLTDVLVAKGRQAELADIVEGQAQTLAEDGDAAGAAALWADVARLVEGALADTARARAAWENAARLDPGAEALDALGRLALSAGEPLAAADWLDRRLAMTEGEARPEVAARLAAAYAAAGQRHRAIACLERALGEAPRAESLRTTLADLYREAASWEPLARVLADGCESVADDRLMVARASEVAEIYGRLGLLERAVPVLEKAMRVVPQNDGLGLALADGLARCGRLDDARAQLARLVEQAGWRRTRKRALLHQRLAEIARAQGDLPRALAELEQASSMDVSNPALLTQLAEVAEAAGDLERAERAYRTLLMQARDDRPVSPDAGGAGLALTEILLRLYGLARKREHAAEADELLDSALAAAIKDSDQAVRLQRGLLESGAYDELARLFEKRLERAAGTPAEAEICAEMAESLRAQGQAEAAFEALLRAVECAPERVALHAALRDGARACGRLEHLVERLLALVERRRRKADMGVASSLLLLAAQIAEHDFDDRGRALDLHRRAEEMQPRSLAVLSSLARLAQQQGDTAECERVAGILKLSAAEASSPGDAAEALYRAAALELARPETRSAGITSLCEALEKNSDLERASALVAAARVPEAEVVRILPLYERIARQSGDAAVLFDYLERRVAASDVTPGEVREAIDLAVALHRDDRVEPLLVRLADVAADRPDARETGTWALQELLRIKKSAADLESAAHILGRLAEAMPMDRVMPLARDLAERAGRAGNARLGAELLERLRASAPADESVWRPLLDHYVSLGDRDGLARLVAETLPLLPTVGQRNQLRLALARVRLAADGADRAGADVLQDLLLEEPGHPEALVLLAGYYESIGSETDLADLLAQAFEAAIAAADPAVVVASALRLGGTLESKSPERAAEIYERARAVAPRSGDLLRRLLALRPADDASREHTTMMEALLDLETGEAAGQLARQLAGAWGNLGDESGVRRVLEKGYAQAAGDGAFFRELERLYRAAQEWAALADLHAAEAERRSDGGEAAALLLEAASLRRGRLADVRGSLELLRFARRRAPHEIAIVEQLARALVAHGELGAAVAEVRTALDDASLPREQRLPLHLLRAKLEAARGDHRTAVAVLEEAFVLSPEAAAPALTAELEAWRQDAAGSAPDDLRQATLRLAELSRAAGEVTRARQLLHELVERGAADAATVQLAWQLADAEGDTESAFVAAQHFVHLATGEAQIVAARQLVALAERIDQVPVATAVVESALSARPDELGLADVLAPLYERTGELAKLAALLLEQANHNPDEQQRFELLRRAGAFAVRAQDPSLAVMALNEALAMNAADEETILLLSDAYLVAGACDDAGALIKPLVSARKGKPSPALATLHLRLARIASVAGDRAGVLAALGYALDADKKNGELAAEVADRAEEAGDDDLALKALRLIVAHNAPGPIGLAAAFLRQAAIAHRRGETERAIMFARRAVHDAPAGDPVHVEARRFLDASEPKPSKGPPPPPRR